MSVLLRTVKSLSLCVLALIWLSGCAGTHLYNKAEDELAQEAQAQLKTAALAKSLQGERARLATILTREIDVARTQVLAQRDAELIAIIGGSTVDASWKSLGGKLEERIRELGGGESADVVRLMNEAEADERTLASNAHVIEVLAAQARFAYVPTCPFTAPSNEPLAALKPLIEEFRTTCGDIVQKRQRLAAQAGAIGQATVTIARIEAAKAMLETDIALKTAEYKNAVRDYKQQLQNLSEDEAVERINELLEKIGKLSAAEQALRDVNVGGLSGSATIAMLEAKRDLVQSLLESFVKGTSDTPGELPKDASREEKLALSLGLLHRELRGASRFLQLPELVIRNEQLRLDIEALRRQVVNSEARLDLMKKRRAAMAVELKLLRDVQVVFVPARDGCGAQSLVTSFVKEKEKCREPIARMLAKYANAWTVARTTQVELQYRLIGLRHDAVMDSSEVALAKWDNLLAVPVAQLAALHASGITPAELASFLQAFGNAAGLTFVGTQIK